MSDIIDSINLFINSDERSNGDYNNFTIQLNSTINTLICEDDEQLFVYPSRVAFTNDFYNIGEQNNTFTFGFTDVGSTSVSLPVGYYNPYNLLDALTTAINNAITLILFTSDASINMTYNPTNNEYDFVIQSNPAEINLTTSPPFFTFPAVSPAKMLGFLDNTSVSFISVSSSYSGLTSINPLNMIYQPEINLKCDILRANYENTTASIAPSQTLLLINQNAPKNSTIIFENTSKLYRTRVADGFGEITFKFEDSNGLPILLQSAVLICLTFEKVKKTTSQDEMITILKTLQSQQELAILQNYINNQRSNDFRKIKNSTK